jgi:hypothetical protein
VKRLVLRFVLVMAGVVAWWSWGVNWADQQGTNHAVLLYLVLGLIGGVMHFYALYRFQKMVNNVRKDERLGLAEPGSTGFAINQRFRYLMRSIEALLIVTVAVFGFISLHNVGFARSPLYIKTVFTYLIGSVAITAYLTYRDLRVINAVRKVDHADAATLRPILRYQHEPSSKEELSNGSEQ